LWPAGISEVVRWDRLAGDGYVIAGVELHKLAGSAHPVKVSGRYVEQRYLIAMHKAGCNDAASSKGTIFSA
jgi:hypothetical protein